MIGTDRLVYAGRPTGQTGKRNILSSKEEWTLIKRMWVFVRKEESLSLSLSSPHMPCLCRWGSTDAHDMQVSSSSSYAMFVPLGEHGRPDPDE